jgi:hypothetical protein
MCFGESRAALDNKFADLKSRMASNGGLWLCWPKEASGVVTDLSDSVVQQIGLDGGLVDNKICSIDATWSAMRFVIRLRDRPAQGGPSRLRSRITVPWISRLSVSTSSSE